MVRLSTIALRLETAEGKRLNRAELCRKAESEGIQEARVKLCDTEGGEALDARVIAFALPPAKPAAARRLMRRKRAAGLYTSADAPIIAGCLMLITSLPADDWPAERVLALYRRRRQAELAFKRLKSLLDLEALRALTESW